MKDLPAALELLADPSPRVTRLRMTDNPKHMRARATSLTQCDAVHLEERPFPMTAESALNEFGDARPQPWRAATALCWRECVRFVRQRNRVIGAIGQPILFWILFGAGMNSTFQISGQSFREYFFPGTMMLILLFTAIFATISIIEDRREGFLQGVLVSPIPRWSMVLGKIMGGALIATLQGLIFLTLALTLGIRFHLGTGLMIVAWLLISSIGLTGLGFVLAWRMDSTQGFHAIMNLLLMPMWLLSGAFFPIPLLNNGTGWGEKILHFVMRCNPVTYAVAGLRRLLYRDTGAVEHGLADIWLPGLGISTFVLFSFATIMCVCAWRMSCRHTSGDLL